MIDTDIIEQASAERIADRLRKIVETAKGGVDQFTIEAIIANASDLGPELALEQLIAILEFNREDDQPFEAAIDQSSGSPLAEAFSLFAGIAAIAAAAVGHTLASSSRQLSEAQRSIMQPILERYRQDSIETIRRALPMAIDGSGSPLEQVRNLIRKIGLSEAQGASIEAMRRIMNDYRDEVSLISDQAKRIAAINGTIGAQRGRLSAAQQALLRKAMTNGITSADAAALLDKHAEKLREMRTKATARHVVHVASEFGKLTGWQIAQRFGFLPKNARRYWVTAGDERVRANHSAVPGLNADGVLLDAPFQTPLGETFAPPLEIGCRCRVRLKQ